MMKTKTPRPRAGKARRASAAPALAPKGSSPSGALSLQLEQVSLVSLLSDRRGAGRTRFEALLEEDDDDPPPPPQLPQPPPPQESPMDADEPTEEKDCCILSQDFFW
jgi:wee1-like protein kinase